LTDNISYYGASLREFHARTLYEHTP